MRKGYSIYQDARYSKENPLATTLAGAIKRTTRNKLKDLENAIDALTIDVSNRDYVAQFISDLERHAEENGYLRRTPNKHLQEQWKTLSEKLRDKYTSLDSFIEHPLTSTVDSSISYAQPSLSSTPINSEKTPVQERAVVKKKAPVQEFVNLPLVNALLLADDPRTRLDQINLPENQTWYAQESARLGKLSAQADALRTDKEKAYALHYYTSYEEKESQTVRKIVRGTGKVAAILLLGASALLSSSFGSSRLPKETALQTSYVPVSRQEVIAPVKVEEQKTPYTALFQTGIGKTASAAPSMTLQTLLVTPGEENLELYVNRGRLQWVPSSDDSSLASPSPTISTGEKQPLTPYMLNDLRTQWVPSDSTISDSDAALARIDTTRYTPVTLVGEMVPRGRVVDPSEPVEVRHRKLLELVIKPQIQAWKAKHGTASSPQEDYVGKRQREIAENTVLLQRAKLRATNSSIFSEASYHPEALVLDPIGRQEQIKRQKEWLENLVAGWSNKNN